MGWWVGKLNACRYLQANITYTQHGARAYPFNGITVHVLLYVIETTFNHIRVHILLYVVEAVTKYIRVYVLLYVVETVFKCTSA
jgi:hypothetical protein